MNLSDQIIQKYNEQDQAQQDKIQKERNAMLMLADYDLHPEQTGISAIYYSHSNTIGFNWNRSYNGKEIDQDFILSVVNMFPVTRNEEADFEVKFTDSSKNIKTDSSCHIKWSKKDKSYKICYASSGINIQIEVPFTYLHKDSFYTEYGDTKKAFGHIKESWNEYHFNFFYSQKYGGSNNPSRVLYFHAGAETIHEYLSFVFTGEFRYGGDILKAVKKVIGNQVSRV